MVLTPEDLDRMVRNTIAMNKQTYRDKECQAALDRAVEAAYGDGEVELAMMLLMCSAARIADDHHAMLTVIVQYAGDQMSRGRWKPQL